MYYLQTGGSFEYGHRHPLRRETAIELSPSKPPAGGLLGCGGSSDTSGAGIGGVNAGVTSGTPGSVSQGAFQVKNERLRHRNSSMEQQQTYQSSGAPPTRATSEFLNTPFESGIHLFKKSNESLQKNSSTETDYSVHPYRFIKQSSNETTTSMTGSYNIDTPSLTADLSLDAGETQSLSQTTVMENVPGTTTSSMVGGTTARYQPLRTSSVGAVDGRRLREEATKSLDATATAAMMSQIPAPPLRAIQLKKQFSLDQGKQQQQAQTSAQLAQQQQQLTQQRLPSDEAELAAAAGGGSNLPIMGSSAKLLSSLKAPLGMNILKESSSEDSRDSGEPNSSSTGGGTDGASGGSENSPAILIPQISTELVQDEIAKLSSNIKSSTESKKDKDPPYNETMC